MPAGAVGASWDPDAWLDTVWEADTWSNAEIFAAAPDYYVRVRADDVVIRVRPDDTVVRIRPDVAVVQTWA